MKLSKALLVGGAALCLSMSILRAEEKPAPVAKSELEVLREKVAAQEKLLRFWSSEATGYSPNALKAPFGRFLLVKSGGQCLAIQVFEHIELVGPSPSKYRWYLQTDGSMDFSKANIQKGEAQVSEFRDGKDYGYDSIKHGNFDLRWTDGDWVDFPEGNQQIQMARVEWIRPEDIRAHDKRILWRSAPKESPKAAAPPK